MYRKLAFFSILSIFFLIWGVSSSGALHKQSVAKTTLPVVASTPFHSGSTQSGLIPVTGKPHLGWEILLVYGLIGFAALTLILALLASANQSTAFYVRRKTPQDETPNE